jgi:hypothetical protein
MLLFSVVAIQGDSWNHSVHFIPLVFNGVGASESVLYFNVSWWVDEEESVFIAFSIFAFQDSFF